MGIGPRIASRPGSGSQFVSLYVCAIYSSVHRSVHSDYLDPLEVKSSERRLTRAKPARHTALLPQTQRRSLSHLQLHARPGVSFSLTFSPWPRSAVAPHRPRALPFTLGRSKGSQTIGLPFSHAQQSTRRSIATSGRGQHDAGAWGPAATWVPAPGTAAAGRDAV